MKRLSGLFLIIIAGLFTTCAIPDTASVRINIGSYQGQNVKSPSWVDRIVRVLTLSKPAYAQSAPTGTLNIRVEISAPDIETYTVSAEGTSDVIEIRDIPAGKDRAFAVVADYDFGQGLNTRYYGGLATVDLEGGDEKDITIEMGNLPQSAQFQPSPNYPVYINIPAWNYWTYVLIYGKHDPTGDWYYVGRVDYSPTGGNYIIDNSVIEGESYIYSIIPYSLYGHGNIIITDPVFAYVN
jgi:hypothetical protein